MYWKRVAWLFLFMIMVVSMTGCGTRFVTGVRKMVGLPQAHRETAKQTEEYYANNVTPRLDVQDAAGTAGDDLEEGITPELAARYRQLGLTKPYDAGVRYNLGRLYFQEGALEQATQEFDMAASFEPQFVWAYIMLGRVLRLRGQYDLAIAKLAVASRLEPKWVLPYIEAGICWDERGFHENAREQYRTALALSPNNLDVYNNLGYSFFLDSQYKEAITYYKKALELAPNDPYANNNIGMAYGLNGNYKQALHHFTVAVGPAAAHSNVGVMFARAGKFEDAAKHFQKSIQFDPESERTLTNLIDVLRILERYDEAEKMRQKLLLVQQRHQHKEGASLTPPSSRATRPARVGVKPTDMASLEQPWNLSGSFDRWEVLLWVLNLIQSIAISS